MIQFGAVRWSLNNCSYFGTCRAILALAVGSPRKLVRDQITDQTHFFLFTSSNPSRADEIIPGRPTTLGNFDPDNDVKIIIHGYTESGDSNWMADMKDAFLARV